MRASQPNSSPRPGVLAALGAFGLVCFLLGLVPLANLLTAGRAIGWWSGAVREWIVRGGAVAGLSLGIAALAGPWVDRIAARLTSWLRAPSPRTFGAGVAVVALSLSAALAQYCFAGRPFTSDEMAQRWQAHILLSGRLALAAESHREFFNTAPVLDQAGHWFSQYPIGGPFFVALGLAAGVAWLVNPLLLALATWCLYRFVARSCDELTARLTAIVFALSPMVLIMGASEMNHVPALAFSLVALAAVVSWDRATTPAMQWRSAAAIGLSLGIVATIRPLDAALVALVVGGCQLRRLWTGADRWRSIAVQCVAGAIPVSLLLWANARTTGAPLLFGYDALNGPAHRLGFHIDPNGEMHTPLRGLILASGYMMRLDRFLFEWPVPALLVVVAGIVALVLTRRASRWDVLFAALATAFLVGYGAYWFDGFFAGPRFLFTAVPAFVYFAVRAPQLIASAPISPIARRAAVVFLPLCVGASWLGPLGISSAAARVMLYRDQRSKLKTDIDAQMHRAGLHHALVFVNEAWRGRLLARLRVLGIQQFEAERVVSRVDACALQGALDAEDTLVARSDSERAARVLARARSFGHALPVPGLAADEQIALVPGSAPTATCLAEVQRDAAGSMPYASFLADQDVGRDGRVGGDVVFARDLGARNELLRARFGDRAWYRYRPPRDLNDTSLAFIPYLPPSVASAHEPRH